MGALKTLMEALSSSEVLTGVSVVFGEENVNAQEHELPMVVVVPLGGQWKTPSFVRNLDPNVNVIWATDEAVEFHLWASDPDADATAIDNAAAVETLRERVLQALQAQRPNGLYYTPLNGRWQLFDNAEVRYGRAYVLTVGIEVSVPDVEPIYADVDAVNYSVVVDTEILS